MNLPCGQCRLCCQLPDLVINVHWSEVSAVEVTFKDKEPRIVKDTSGACIYLGADGCTIYSRRPDVCRTFTCERFLDDDLFKQHNETTIARTLDPLRRAAKAMLGRHKRSISRRFNSALAKKESP